MEKIAIRRTLSHFRHEKKKSICN